jgi:hypothetical protein
MIKHHVGVKVRARVNVNIDLDGSFAHPSGLSRPTAKARRRKTVHSHEVGRDDEAHQLRRLLDDEDAQIRR